jgi:hypothetical protein
MPADVPPLPANANVAVFAVDRYCEPPGKPLDWHPVAIPNPVGGRPIRWFPIADQTADVLSKLADGGPLHIWHRAKGRKCGPIDRGVWRPEAPPVAEPAPPPAPVAPPEPASAPSTALAAPSTALAAPPPPAPVPPNGKPALALVPPGYVPRPPPNYMPATAEPAFERYHHLAAEDADRVVLAVTNLGAAFQSAVAQMAAATIAVSGQRASEWQGLASQLLAQAAAPKPADPALAQLAQGQQAIAAALQTLASKVEALEADADDVDDTPPPGAAEPTDGQKLMAAIAPLAIEYGPKLAAKLWPDAPAAAAGDGSPRA